MLLWSFISALLGMPFAYCIFIVGLFFPLSLPFFLNVHQLSGKELVQSAVGLRSLKLPPDLPAVERSTIRSAAAVQFQDD
jgi:hypothetical protein